MVHSLNQSVSVKFFYLKDDFIWKSEIEKWVLQRNRPPMRVIHFIRTVQSGGKGSLGQICHWSFCGPFVSKQVRIGSYVSGEPRLLTFHWTACKIAHMREEAETGSRPKLGRPPKASLLDAGQNQSEPSVAVPHPTHPSSSSSDGILTPNAPGAGKQSPSFLPSNEGAQIQTSRPVRSSRNPNPRYVSAVAAWIKWLLNACQLTASYDRIYLLFYA